MEADLRFATVRKVKQTITAANSTLQLLNDDESEELPPVCCESSNLPSSFKIDFDFSSLTQVINNFGNLSQNLLWDDVCKDHDENCMAFSDNEHRGKSQLNTMAQQKGISTRFTFPNPSFPPFHIRGQGKGSIAQNSRSKTARPVRCPAGGKNLSMDLTCPIRRPRQFPVASRPTSSVLPINASTAVSELVIASHIESPVHFYVRYCADYNLYFQWNKVLQSTCERVTHLPDSIALGQFLCVRSLIDDSWYRARILALTKVGDETESHGYHCLEDKTQSSCSTSRNEDMDNDAHDYTCPIACPETTSSAILEIARDACTFFLESPDECGKMIKCSEVNTDLKNDLSYLQPEDETMSREWNGEKNDDMSDLVATQLMNCIDKTTEEAHTKHSVIQAKTREELEIEIINGLTNFEEAEFTLCAHHGVVPQQELENCGKKWCGYQEAVPLDSVLQLECFLLDHGRKEIFNCRSSLGRAASWRFSLDAEELVWPPLLKSGEISFVRRGLAPLTSASI
uniref:Tudor domain-containing protein n=1 Tax=Eptatretus burgeri TaxID=7764 RepID=A0A8C4NDC6_EPTBU